MKLHYKCYDASMDHSYVYEYLTNWHHSKLKEGGNPLPEHNATLEHFIVIHDYTHDGTAIQINFDPYSVMTRRDFERLVDYYKVKGDFPVHIIPDTPIRSGEPSYFCAINGIA